MYLHLTRALAAASTNEALEGAGLQAPPAEGKKKRNSESMLAKWAIMGQLTLTEVPHAGRIHGKFAEAFMQSLSVGELPEHFDDPEKFTLEGHATRETVDLGRGLQYSVDENESAKNAQSSAEYVNRVCALMDFAVCLGVSENPAHPTAPTARTIIEIGKVTTSAGVVETWDMVPSVGNRYKGFLRNAQEKHGLGHLRTIHQYVSARTREHLNAGRNLASGLAKAMEVMSADAIVATHGGAASDRATGARALPAKKAGGGHGGGGVLRAKDDDPPRARGGGGKKTGGYDDPTCRRYQEGHCSLGANCQYRHVCRKCGGRHGAVHCERGRRSPERRSRSPDRRGGRSPGREERRRGYGGRR